MDVFRLKVFTNCQSVPNHPEWLRKCRANTCLASRHESKTDIKMISIDLYFVHFDVISSWLEYNKGSTSSVRCLSDHDGTATAAYRTGKQELKQMRDGEA